MNELLSLLCFPQKWDNGILYFNIVILPRNLNPLLPWDNNVPAFADGNIVFSAKLIPSLDGLPIFSLPVTISQQPKLIDPATQRRAVWEALQLQFETADKIVVVDADENIPGTGRAPQPSNEIILRKYLPLSYRKAFNFVKPRTKYAVIGDEYRCSIKNQSETVNVPPPHNNISWGNLVSFSLRNPMLAKKLGLIYEASIDLSATPTILDDGGWLYVDLADTDELGNSGDFHDTPKKIYAARIPSLKNKASRSLFSVNQFRVTNVPGNENSAGYDEIIRECIMYDDGFAKIVHANQPVNQDLSLENDASNPPMNDVGIRLGWEDEQITIWYNRQLQHMEELTGKFVDAPMGVFGYHIDVRESGQKEWHSQNSVVNTASMQLANTNIEIVPANTVFEPGTEVTPVAHGNVKERGFWAPMYYTSWIGKSLATADKDAADINLLKHDTVENTGNGNDTTNLVPKETRQPYMQEPSQHLPLRYGKHYDFQVRLMDISGGGPKNSDERAKGGENPIGEHTFKRYVGAGAVKIDEMEQHSDSNDGEIIKDVSVLANILKGGSTLNIRRPLLSYPAVVFTDKYEDPVTLMKAHINSHQNTVERKAIDVGLPDPDVDQFLVLVEARSLEMDNGVSELGTECYIKLYEKMFAFPVSALFDETFPVKIVYRDFDDVDLGSKVLDLEGAADDALVLPTARQLRITFTSFISITEIKNQIYADKSIARGKTVQLTAFQPSLAEENLLSLEPDNVNAFYLQPENNVTLNLQKVLAAENIVMRMQESQTPAELLRLADRLNIVAKNLTVQGEKGQRVQFGCSREIRHSLAPDSSSVTLSSIHDLFNHWIVALDFNIERDWTWNGLQVNSFSVYRTWNVPETGYINEKEKVGTIQISNIANINALYNADRSKTRVIFLDVMDPKETFKDFPDTLDPTKTFKDFPREFNLNYEIVVHFKEGFSTENSSYKMNEVALPITIIPAQIPKLVSAGIALTPYIHDEEKYSFTAQRSKYLWLEFDEPLKDPNTIYQVRVLASACDPLLSKITEEKLTSNLPDEPIQLDAELIRHIIPGMANDSAGVKAMQPMISEQLPDAKDAKIFMVPLPKNLHGSSDELFGFFTYEIRVGYKPEIWSTAQARFGRPLKANGVQHPAPNLFCTASVKDLLSYEKSPLRAHENHLLNEMMAKDILASKRKKLDFEDFDMQEVAALSKTFEKLTTIEEKKKLWREKLPEMFRFKSKRIILVKAPYAMAVEDGKNVTASPPQTSLWYLLYTQVKQADGKSYRNILIDSGMLNVQDIKKDSVIRTYHSDERCYGSAQIVLSDIQDRLQLMGLPRSNDLSILVAEMFPMHNSWSIEYPKKENSMLYLNNKMKLLTKFEDKTDNINVEQGNWGNPLIEDLGKYRIYRTSPLIPIELGCCEDC